MTLQRLKSLGRIFRLLAWFGETCQFGKFASGHQSQLLVAYKDVLHLLFFRFIEAVVHYLAVSQRLFQPFDFRNRHGFAKHIHLDFIEPSILFEHTLGFVLVLARCKDLTMEQSGSQRHDLRLKFVLAVLVEVIQQVVVALHHFVE